MPDVKYPDVEVELSGHDGNAFAIIGRVTKALKRAGHDGDAFAAAAMDCGSYDDLLRYVMATVETS